MLGYFSIYLAEQKAAFDLVFLALSTIEDEKPQSADEHSTFFTYVLRSFDKSCKIFMALFEEHCNIYHSSATKLKNSLTGCFFRRFRLSMREVIYEAEDNVILVQSQKMKLLKPLLRANLYPCTHLCAKLSNSTSYTIVHGMPKRHVNVRYAVLRLDEVHLDDVLIATSTKRRIETKAPDLEKLNEVFLNLQSKIVF